MTTTLNPAQSSFHSRLLHIGCAILALFALTATTAVAESILNSQEQAIASRMVNDSNQKRGTMTLDPTLARVARARAADMAKRKYFAHVNPDGVAANYLVEKAGYNLPDWWSDDPKANYIESIAAGYASPDSTWSGWMNSSDHRTHILGLNSFYASETSYGVGYYYDADSPYKHYWVILTAPPQPAPNLAITAPATNAKMTASSVTFTGTASSASGATSVQARVENASGASAYQVASGVANWSVNVGGLLPGANTVRVRSLNASGSVIAELTRAVNYVVMGTLTVNVSQGGSVTAGYAGESQREVGKKYTITAVPAAGYLFTGWSGGINATTPAITFAMSDGLSLQANFIPNPFIPLKGTYNGLIGDSTDAAHSGFLRATLTPAGVLTARMTLDGVNHAFTARFTTDGTALVKIARKGGLAPLTVNLQLDVANGTEQITGTVSDGTWTAGISTDRMTFHTTLNRAPQTGRYTAVLATSGINAALPPGSGYATVVVAANGVATVTGKLADGTAFTQSTAVSKTGMLPLYLRPVGALSTVVGTASFRETEISDLDGSVVWTRLPRATDAYYPNGFSTALSMVGSRYTNPAVIRQAARTATTATPVTTPTTTTVGLGGGNVDPEIEVQATLTGTNKIVTPAGDALKLALAINPATGIVSGTFVQPGGKIVRTVFGVVLQKQNSAYGYFRGTDQYGWFGLAGGVGN